MRNPHLNLVSKEPSTPPRNRQERRKQRFARKLGAVLTVGLVLGSGITMAGATFSSTAAHAIDLGAGVWFAMGGQAGAGAFMYPDGTIAYCAELGRLAIMGANPALGPAGALPAYNVVSFNLEGNTYNNVAAGELSGAGLDHYKYVLSHYGATADNGQAAAVQIALWELRAPGASASYQSLLTYMKNGVGADVVAAATSMIAEAVSYTGAQEAPGDIRITPGLNPYTGTAHIDAGTTEVSISNGVFTMNGTNHIVFDSPTTTAMELAFVGQPSADVESWDRYYRVTVTGKYQYTVDSTAVMYGSPGGIGQGLVSSAPAETRTGDYDAVYLDPDTIWSPTLTTETTSKFVQVGEQFSDSVTFGVADGSNPWRVAFKADRSKLNAPVTGVGTLYGPFNTDPADNPSATPPKNAPIAAKASVTTSTEQGPGTYQVVGDSAAVEPGYYSWVWEIRYEDQLPSVQSPKSKQPSLPANYYFTDGFGQATEGQITPSDISFTTQLSGNQVSLGGKLTDNLSVSLNRGAWLQTDGERTPFTVRGTVYGSNVSPEQQVTAPADAQVLSTTSMVINGPYETLTSADIEIPWTTDARYVTVQWCLLDEDQPESSRGKAKEYCDDYGVPSETAEIVRPLVTTQAQPTGAYKGDIHDVALVEGSIIEGVKNEIDFTYYLQPKTGEPKYDSNWEKVVDTDGKPILWTAEEVSDPAAVCKAQPVATTDRVEVTAAGIVTAPAVIAGSVGVGYWGEKYIVTPPGGDETVIHEGLCGIENEKTVVEWPTVTTEAQSDVVVGEDIWDNIIASGEFSSRVEYEVTVKAYTGVEGEPMVCSPENEIKDFEDSTGVKVDKAGRYESKKTTTTEAHIGQGGFAETLWLIEKGEKSVVAVGKCGEPTEKFVVKPKPEVPVTPEAVVPPLAVTGAEPLLPLAGAVAALLLAGGVAMTLTKRRRDAAAASVTTPTVES